MTDTTATSPTWPGKPEASIIPLAYRPAEAAAALGLSPRKLWDLTQQGEVPHIRVGRCLLYPVREVQDWLTSRVREGAGNE